MSADSAPVPDLDELIFEMGKLHQQCIKREIIQKDIVDLFMTGLAVTDEDKKVEKVQRRIAFLTKQLAPQTIPFANGGEIIEKLPTVHDIDDKHFSVAGPVPVQVRMEAYPERPFASNMRLDRRPVHVKQESVVHAAGCKMRFESLQSILFQRHWCYDYMLKFGTRATRNDLAQSMLEDAPWTRNPRFKSC